MKHFTHLKPKTEEELIDQLSTLYMCDLHMLKSVRSTEKSVVEALDNEIKRRGTEIGCKGCPGKPADEHRYQNNTCNKNLK